MKSEELKKIQAPLKEKYRNNPESAFVTLKASGKTGEGISCKVDTGKVIIEAGLHPATGGNGKSVCSGDMLLEALVACTGVTLGAVATALEIEIKKAEIKAEGDIDFSGTLGVFKDSPVGFKEIRIMFLLDCNANEDKIATLLKLTERYCVVYQTLKNGVSMKAGFEKLS